MTLTMASRRKKNLLANRQATVSVTRNGLFVQIDSVPATESGLVSQALLDMVRNLIEAGYEELVVEGGSFHGGGYDVPDEDGIETETDPTVAKRRSIGFHAK